MTIAGQLANISQLAVPATPATVITEQARATTTKETIFGRNPKIKRMLVV
jgi:hypothetical protein